MCHGVDCDKELGETDKTTKVEQNRKRGMNAPLIDDFGFSIWFGRRMRWWIVKKSSSYFVLKQGNEINEWVRKLRRVRIPLSRQGRKTCQSDREHGPGAVSRIRGTDIYVLIESVYPLSEMNVV